MTQYEEMTPSEGQIKAAPFLKELSELSRKHGVYISGCGCCGSPSLIFDNKPDNGGYDVDERCEQLTWETPDATK